MNFLEETLKDISSQVSNILAEGIAFQDITAFLAKKEEEVNNFARTGNFHTDIKVSDIKRERITNVIPNDDSLKENINENQNTVNTVQPVKLERVSEAIPRDITKMPPPQQPIRKGRAKKATDAMAIKKEPLTSNKSCDFETFIQPPQLSDSTDVEDEIGERLTRSCRTKTRTTAARKDKIESEKENDLSNQNGEKTQSNTGNDERSQTLLNIKKETNLDVLQPVNINLTDTLLPKRSTRTKTRAMAAKQPKELQEDEKGYVEQSTVIEDSEKMDKTITISKSTTTSTSSEEEKISKLKKKGKKPPIRNADKHQKPIESNKNGKISDETFIKSPQEESKKTSPVDQTIVINKPVDATVILDKPSIANKTDTPINQITNHRIMLNNQVIPSDLMTDDEDDEIPSKPVSKKPGKPMFSEFENSPVKKRVEAFEKLGTVKGTTKLDKKLKLKSTKDEDDKNKKSIVSLKPAVKNKIKMFNSTPMKNSTRGLQLTTESASKAVKASVKDVLLQPKSASALKAYQQDFIERELRRQEKELEVARKREALLQAKRDENKRKREEKQLKAQQAREALVKANQGVQETIKSVKVAEQKSTMTDNRPQGERKEPVYRTPIKQIKNTPAKKIPQKPVFLDISAPLLPLDDCYDSDDERNKGHTHRPEWTRRHRMHPNLTDIGFACDEAINTFYMRKATTPDLELIFGRINPKKLKRTSSAIWSKPPRFTIMPIPNEEDEDNIS